MNTPTPLPVPPAPSPMPAKPWYESPIFVALVTLVITRVVNIAQQKYHFDISVYGVTVNDLVSYALDGVGAICALVIAYYRAKIAPLTLTKSKANALNAY